MALSEKDKALLILKKVRARIPAHVLHVAQQAAFEQIGQVAPEPENEASRLFKLATANNGARRGEILAMLENRFRSKLN